MIALVLPETYGENCMIWIWGKESTLNNFNLTFYHDYAFTMFCTRQKKEFNTPLFKLF